MVKIYNIRCSDADWTNDVARTTSNVLPIKCQEKLSVAIGQTTLALSTAEAEIIVLGSATQEAIWLHQLLNDLKIDTKGSIEIMENNPSTITCTVVKSLSYSYIMLRVWYHCYYTSLRRS